MIRRDFISGGFPVNRRAPVICINGQGSVYIAHSNYDIKRILDDKNVKIVTLLGVWPGRRNTDCFILDPSHYGKIAPPQEHRDIDSSIDIKVFIGKEGKFVRLEYTLGPQAEDQTKIISTSMELYKYIEQSNLKRTTESV